MRKCSDYKRGWYLAHKNDPGFKERRKIAQRKWRQKYPEKNNAISARHRKKHRDEVNEKGRIYSALHREEAKLRASTWYKLNPERVKDNCSRRRQREINGSANCSAKISSLSKSGFCHWCFGVFDLLNRPVIDHVKPLARGGRHIPGNLVASCARCNREKHSRFYWEWDGELAS